ncbi:shikimate dehydrogenase [Streptomyces sp. NRRL S-350]|uniref:shikimate dehydrogenase n=1 Tax=Streptomyces sp. NRRL S-350 TaxID=1463902 RepID=UPI0004BE5841|nr:shikimate dehydrogenase [Streptomyces sp. NRRL S-350]
MDAVGAEYTIGLIGAGIQGSLSPVLHTREAARHGLRCHYRLLDLDESGPATGPELVARARAAGLRGVGVTHPCKRDVLPVLDRLSPEAEAIGAVNTIVFDEHGATGHNTDGTGFMASLRHGLPDADLDRVTVLGAGGAGAAVAHALLASGARRLTVLDTDPAAAGLLATRLRALFGDAAVATAPLTALATAVAGATGLVNATPVGMPGSPGCPVPTDRLRPGTWVADLVYRPAETELLARARAAGCRTLPGGGMLVHQAVEGFRLFTGIRPDARRMTADFAASV